MNNWSDVSLALPCCFAISIGSCIRCGEQSLFVPEQDRTLSEIGLQNNTLSERVMDYQISILERAFHVICEFRPACGINCSFPLGLDRHESPGTRTLFFVAFGLAAGVPLNLWMLPQVLHFTFTTAPATMAKTKCSRLSLHFVQ